MINGLDLFSGIGGLTLALSPWVKPVAYCEIERYARAVLLSRISEGELVNAPIWDDVRTLKGSMLPTIDIVYGGFPCQDVSTAGLRKGLDGERTRLFFEAVRLIRECRPKFVFLENVPGIRKYVPTVRQELEALGYDCRDGFLSASEVGAPHVRQRWWLLAHTNRSEDGIKYVNASKRDDLCKSDQDVANVVKLRLEGLRISGDVSTSNEEKTEPQTWDYFRIGNPNWWDVEPEVGRMVNGIPFASHRIRGLGNAVVPAQAREAFKILMGIKEG